MKIQYWLLIMVALMPAGCGNESHLSGDGENEGDGASGDAVDATHDPAPDESGAESSVDPSTEEATETVEGIDAPDADDMDGACCEPPMVLDPVKGICIDPTGYGAECAGLPDTCRFGQSCVPEWNIDLIGFFCQITCGEEDNYLCPEGYVCFPPHCCETIPGLGCIVDTCTPPLLLHPGTQTCVTFEGAGAACESALACGTGQTCLSWYGIDGIERHTCEVECAGYPRLCPNGFRCADYDDGPSNICEPAGGQRGCDDPQALVCGHPEKFNGAGVWEVDRTMVCPRCYGVKFCTAPDGVLQVQSMIPGTTPCEGQGMCGSGLIECTFEFRSGIDDCPGGMPSDYFWTTVCNVADIDAVQSVLCYYLE